MNHAPNAESDAGLTGDELEIALVEGGLLAVLNQHTVEDWSEGEYDGDASLLCSCRFVARGSDLYDAGDSHRAHIAKALVQAIA